MHRMQFLKAGAAFAGFGLAGCATAKPNGQAGVPVTITAVVPEGTGPLYLTGNLPTLGPWNPKGFLMDGAGRERAATIRAPAGHELEYKFTLGSWDREGLGPSGTVMPNNKLLVAPGARARVEIPDFKKDPSVYMADPKGSGVLGTMHYWPDTVSKHLDRKRHVVIWLPPGYEANAAQRYRVIYMHDGQNLFDPRIANTGTDWGVDEAMMRLAGRGAIEPAIVVGAWSTDLRRLEYAPTKVLAELQPPALRQEVEAEFGGATLADAYIRFLAEELKPRVDAAFRTRPGPEDTALMGSSMGGLISLYGLAERPDVFGAAACLSMHWPMAIVQKRIVEGGEVWRTALIPAYQRYLQAAGFSPQRQRLWADHGTVNLDSLYAPYQEAIAPVFAARGFVEGKNLALRVYPGTDHNEAAWRARLEDPLRFLLAR
jgi:enterochelin esterase-like enzyme